jgi:hypothetical protein
MNIQRHFILQLFSVIFISGFVFTACNPNSAQNDSTYLQEPKELNLDAEQEQSADQTPDASDNYQEDTRQFARVQLPPGYQVVQLVDVNLDLDRYEEQVLVAQDTLSEESTISLIVADYDTIRDKYTTTWQSKTVAQQRKGLQVTVIDVTGDHNMEIVCNGINADGLQTIDVFRRTTSPDEYGLYFDRILSLEVQGTIELQESKRSQSYQNGLTNGASYPVVTSSKDTESERMSDIIKRTYIWRNDSRTYELVLEKKVSGQEIEDRRLKELFESGSEAFEEFLSGPWLYSKTAGENSPQSQRALIHFNSIDNTITLFSGNVQEIYTWTSSHRFLANSLAIRGENEIVPFMRIYISAYVEDLNNVRLLIYDINSHNGQRSTNTSWSGMYQKIGSSLQDTFLSSYPTDSSKEHLPTLNGVYESDIGDEITFEPPYFTLERDDEDGVKYEGGFSVYSMGSDILELKIMNRHGIVVERRCYSFDYFEEKKSNEIIRRLILLPGKIGVHGFIPTEKQPIRYEQVEKIEE